MSDTVRPVGRDDETHARYPVRLLCQPEAGPEGVAFREGTGRRLLPWSRVERAIAAEVGEPEGVRTIVFDLVSSDRHGLVVYRLDAEPGQEAIALARAIEAGLGPGRPSASIKSVATDGIPTRWYPDLLSFEEEALSLVADA